VQRSRKLAYGAVNQCSGSQPFKAYSALRSRAARFLRIARNTLTSSCQRSSAGTFCSGTFRLALRRKGESFLWITCRLTPPQNPRVLVRNLKDLLTGAPLSRFRKKKPARWVAEFKRDLPAATSVLTTSGSRKSCCNRRASQPPFHNTTFSKTISQSSKRLHAHSQEEVLRVW